MTEEQVRTGWLLTRISGGPTEAAKSSPGTFLGFAGARCSGFGNFRVDLREPFSRSRLKSAAAEAVKLGPGQNEREQLNPLTMLGTKSEEITVSVIE